VTTRVVFKFKDDELAKDFLAYMSDGGGDYEFAAYFDYHKYGAFGTNKKKRVVEVSTLD
jgi:hypothetical protein